VAWRIRVWNRRWYGFDFRFVHYLAVSTLSVQIATSNKGGPLTEYQLRGVSHGPCWKQSISDAIRVKQDNLIVTRLSDLILNLRSAIRAKRQWRISIQYVTIGIISFVHSHALVQWPSSNRSVLGLFCQSFDCKLPIVGEVQQTCLCTVLSKHPGHMQIFVVFLIVLSIILSKPNSNFWHFVMRNSTKNLGSRAKQSYTEVPLLIAELIDVCKWNYSN